MTQDIHARIAMAEIIAALIRRQHPDFHRFWELRGGPDAFEAWRLSGQRPPELLIRVEAPNFVAGFTTDGEIRECAPILRKHLMGKSESQARAVIKQMGWKATVVPQPEERP